MMLNVIMMIMIMMALKDDDNDDGLLFSHLIHLLSGSFFLGIRSES